MANAQTAPLKEKVEYQAEVDFLAQKFDPKVKYMFELAVKNPKRELPVIDMRRNRPAPHQEFKPSQNIVFTSQIIWKGQRRMVRYYDGCDTIFVDEQPKDRETIEQYIRQTKKRNFLEGKFGCYGDERQLLLFMFVCSWNAESEFRTRSADAVFIPSNSVKKADQKLEKLERIEEAMKKAKEASLDKMFMHAAYLGIPTTDWDSGNELTEKEIRVAYREQASEFPDEFIRSYGDKTIELRYYIRKALEQGIITNKVNPNKATWGKNDTVICDISGLKSHDAIVDKLLEFSQLEEGAEFSIQLKGLFK